MHPGDIRKQTERMWENVEVLLQEADCTFDDLGQMIVYLRDIADYTVVKGMYDKRFPHTPKVFVHAPVCRPGWLIAVSYTHLVAGGKQGIFEEDNFSSPAYVARLDYKGVPGLRVGASFYYCADAGSNSDKLDSYSSKVPLRIFTADAQYRNKYVIARGNICLLYTSQAFACSIIKTYQSPL